MPDIVFVDVTPVARSARERELERSRVRSHAATVSHRESRARQSTKHKDGEAIGITYPVYHGLPVSTSTPERRSQAQAFGRSALHRPNPHLVLVPVPVPAPAPAPAPAPPTSTSSQGSIDRSSSSSDQGPENRFIISNVIPIRRAHLPLLKSIPSDFACYRSIRTNPFDYTSNQSLAATDYFAQVMAPHLAPIYKIFNVTNIFTNFLFELLQHEDYFYAIAASSLVAIDNSWQPVQMPPLRLLEYLKIAMARLRHRLTRANGVADVLSILAVQALAITADATGDLTSHEIHKKSLVPLVDSCGGINNLGYNGQAKSLLLHWEACWALYSDSALFPSTRPKHVPYYPQFPFSEVIRVRLGKLPLGFERLAQQRKLSLPTLEVLARTTEAAERQRAGESVIRDAREYFQVGARRYDGFWEACPCLRVPDDMGEDRQRELEELVVLALILYCAHTFSPIRAMSAIYVGVRKNLAESVVRTPVDVSKDGRKTEEDVMVWIWMNVVDAWRGKDDELHPRGLELVRILKERFGDVREEEEMVRRFRLFFSDVKFERRCRGYWDAVRDVERV